MHAASLFQITLLVLASSSWAITVTKPAQGDTWTSQGPNVVTWTEVSTDPNEVTILLVESSIPQQTLASNVQDTAGSFTVTNTLPIGTDFQVNLVNASNTAQILAQSFRFNITQGGSSSSVSSTGTGSATSSSSTVSGSATTAGTSSTNIPNASGASSSPTATTSNAASLSSPSRTGIVGLLALFGLALV